MSIGKRLNNFERPIRGRLWVRASYLLRRSGRTVRLRDILCMRLEDPLYGQLNEYLWERLEGPRDW